MKSYQILILHMSFIFKSLLKRENHFISHTNQIERINTYIYESKILTTYKVSKVIHFYIKHKYSYTKIETINIVTSPSKLCLWFNNDFPSSMAINALSPSIFSFAQRKLGVNNCLQFSILHQLSEMFQALTLDS